MEYDIMQRLGLDTTHIDHSDVKRFMQKKYKIPIKTLTFIKPSISTSLIP
jgi:hypothetical protein